MKFTKKPVLTCLLSAVILFSACSDDDNDNNDLNMQDRDFVSAAALGNTAEVMAGTLAAAQAEEAGVKMYGSQMVTDHTTAQTELKTIGANSNITVKDSVDAAHVQLMDQLEGLSGREFDSVYVNSQIKDHKTVIAAFEQEVNAGNRTAVKAYANKYLPKLRMHLQMADSIATAMNFKADTP